MKFKYAQVTFFDKVIAYGILASTPIYVGILAILAALTRLIVPEKRRQTLAFIAFRYMAGTLSYNQFQWIAGTDDMAYDKFIRSSGLPHCVDRMRGDTAKLMWVGTKTLDKVLVYLHGGGYLFPLMKIQLAYLVSLQRELANRGIQAGVAALSYTLVPEDFFPRQLRETKDAIDSLLASGVKAENIVLIGDSAGANLILQALAHVLHPHPSVPPFAHGIRFAGACLVSPWVDLDGYAYPQTFADYDSVDMIDAKTYRYMGKVVKVGVSSSDVPFMDALEAPKDWFLGVEDVVERILVTAGEYECLLEGQKAFYERLSASGHDDVLFKVHSKGTHVEVMRLDPKTGRFPVFNDNVVGWFVETFNK